VRSEVDRLAGPGVRSPLLRGAQASTRERAAAPAGSSNGFARAPQMGALPVLPGFQGERTRAAGERPEADALRAGVVPGACLLLGGARARRCSAPAPPGAWARPARRGIIASEQQPIFFLSECPRSPSPCPSPSPPPHSSRSPAPSSSSSASPPSTPPSARASPPAPGSPPPPPNPSPPRHVSGGPGQRHLPGRRAPPCRAPLFPAPLSPPHPRPRVPHAPRTSAAPRPASHSELLCGRREAVAAAPPASAARGPAARPRPLLPLDLRQGSSSRVSGLRGQAGPRDEGPPPPPPRAADAEGGAPLSAELRGALEAHGLARALWPALGPGLRALGVASRADLALLDEGDLRALPLPPVARRRLAAAAQHELRRSARVLRDSLSLAAAALARWCARPGPPPASRRALTPRGTRTRQAGGAAAARGG
jgi:hypothetical protein